MESIPVKMQGGSYGIFEDEIEPILRRIRRHDNLAAIEATRCPCCEARIRICFWPDGLCFQVICFGEPPHFSVLQDFDEPPTWWAERVIEPVESIVTYFVDEPESEASHESTNPKPRD